VAGGDEPALIAEGVPAGVAITGVEGVRLHSLRPDLTASVAADVLGFAEAGPGLLRTSGATRSGTLGLDDPPDDARRTPGAGTIHHVAWAAEDEDHVAWRDRLHEAGLHATDVIDRQYFRSVYFREPGGILFEIATMSPGFAVDEPVESLGESLRLPPQYEGRREEIERRLRPLERPRAAAG
jgi:glyoxalase family protein